MLEIMGGGDDGGFSSSSTGSPLVDVVVVDSGECIICKSSTSYPIAVMALRMQSITDVASKSCLVVV